MIHYRASSSLYLVYIEVILHNKRIPPIPYNIKWRPCLPRTPTTGLNSYPPPPQKELADEKNVPEWLRDSSKVSYDKDGGWRNCKTKSLPPGINRIYEFMAQDNIIVPGCHIISFYPMNSLPFFHSIEYFSEKIITYSTPSSIK